MQIVYNGSYSSQVRAGDITFLAGVPTEVDNTEIAAGLLAKPHFSPVAAKPAPTVKKEA